MILRTLPRAFLAIVFLAGTSPVASAAPAVEDYARQTLDAGVAILKDKSLSASARRARVDEFLLATLDVKRLALFMLGDAAKGASQSDLDAYTQAFQNFTLANYTSDLGAYDGETFAIVGSKQHATGDYILSVNVIEPSASASDVPATVRFRIVDENGKIAVVDANVEGVWFELAQRDSIRAFLAQNRGSIPKLVDYLNQKTAQFSAAP